MKPFLLEKYPKKSTKLFYENSDIHYIIQLLDKLRTECGVKLEIKEENKPEIKEASIIKEQKQNVIIIKKEEKNISNNNEIVNDEKDINNLKGKIETKIINFLDDFIEENKLKRANSMLSLRTSKTLSSFTTCDDSIFGGDTGHKKAKINLNQLLIIDNSELNQKIKNAKDIMIRSKNLYQASLEKKNEEKDPNKELPILKKPKPGMKKEQTMSLFMNINPKFKDQEEIEKVNIEYKDKEKTLIKNISVDLLFKKIIFENFLTKNALLIYHFCKQCFCFVIKEIIFKKLFDCYKTYMNKKTSFDKLKNLIEFITILVLEMFEYYEKINFNEMQIKQLKKFYNELIIYLLSNNEQKKENKKEKEINNKNENNIINEKNILRINTITKDDQYIFNENNDIIHIDKKNLINLNLNYDEKDINILIIKNKNKFSKNSDKETNHKIDKTLKTKDNNDNTKDLSKEINIEFPSFYKISKTLKRKINISNINKSSDKLIKNAVEEIKEESSEDDSNSSSDEDSGENGKKNKDKDKDKKDSSSEEQNSKDENNINIKEKEIENNNGIEIINNILNKVFNKNDIILSAKDDLMNEIKYMNKILNVKDNDNISQKSIIEIKSIIPFYTSIKINKKKEMNNLNNSMTNITNNKISKFNLFAKTRTLTMSDLSSKSSNIKANNNKQYFCITDWPTEEIANKLTQVSISLLNKINPRELYKAVFLKNEKEISSPNVCNTITNFNKLTSFIIEDIISYNSPKIRARVYEKWVQVCDYCRNIKNYNDCIAIYSALNNFIITGLNLTCKEIKYSTKRIFDQISILCSCEANYKNIRNDMHLCEEKGITFIPYLGMLLRDINFLEESSKYINQKGNVNIEKIEKINDLLEKYFKYKIKDDNNRFSDLKKCSKELNFFDKLEIIKEEDLENIAHDIEPVLKYDKQEIKRLTKIDVKYFTKKNKKNSNITPRKTFLGTSSMLSNINN